MDWNEILLTIVKGVATALLTVIGGYAIYGIKEFFAWVDSKIKDSSVKGIVDNIQTLIIESVDATEQTFVKTIKETGNWDEVKKGEAFQKAFDGIVASLNEKAKTTIVAEYGNLDTWLTNKIEAYIKSLHD